MSVWSAAKTLIFSFVLLTFLSVSFSLAADFGYIEELIGLRDSFAEQGQLLPPIIKVANGTDLRTLERLFELNTSALTTIEAYFRIFKIALSAENGLTEGSVAIMNEWLTFIGNQCRYDMEYLDAALTETKDEAPRSHIKQVKKNVARLIEIATKGIRENGAMLR